MKLMNSVIVCRALLLFILFTLQWIPVSAITSDQLNVEAQLRKAVAEQQLNFPVLTQKIYRDRAFQSLWFNSDLKHNVLWKAADLIPIITHYGLNQRDYHCEQLSAGNLNSILESSLREADKPRIDILLTDAMLSLTAHLHYGKSNPSFSRSMIDSEQFKGLKVDSLLLAATRSQDFQTAILSVQPVYQGYRDLQEYMKLLVGQYIGDCYEISDETVKLIALNLERWRWLNTLTERYVLINIPAFGLKYINGDQAEEFKIIVGKPATPTPVLSSKIRFFTTAPDWTVPPNIAKNELIPKAIKNPSYLKDNNFRIYDKKGKTIEPTAENLVTVRSKISAYTIRQSPGCDNALGQIVFNFENPYSVYLHDTPDRSLFNRSNRALSHGCIRVEKSERLAELFLENDNSSKMISEVHSAMKQYKRKKIHLKKPIPISINYFTCEVKDGILHTYKDLYNKDKSLAKAMNLDK